jgi:hypothetical protein
MCTAPLAPQVNTLHERPELPRLGSSPLLVRAYDLGLVSASGEVDSGGVRRVMAEQRYGPFRSEGFFGLVPRQQLQVCGCAAAVLLLRTMQSVES